MSDLDERIRRLFDTPRPVSLDEIVVRKASPASAPRRWRLRAVITVGACVVVFAGVIGLVVTKHHGSTNIVASSTTSSTLATAPVEIRLVLDRTRVSAGTPIRGQVLFVNTTGKTITVEGCAANGWLSVGLTNSEVSYSPVTSLIQCRPTVRLSPGLSRFPISISTDFQLCTQTSSQATPQVPVCKSRRGSPSLPPLPPGHYITKIVTTGLPAGTKLPSAIRVTLRPAD